MEEKQIDWRSPVKNLVICIFLWTGILWIPGCIADSVIVESAVEGAISWAEPSIEDFTESVTQEVVGTTESVDLSDDATSEEADTSGFLRSIWDSTTEMAGSAKDRTVEMAASAYEGTTDFLGQSVTAIHQGIYSGTEFFLRAILKILVWILVAGFLAFRGYIKAEEFVGSVFVDFLPSLFK